MSHSRQRRNRWLVLGSASALTVTGAAIAAPSATGAQRSTVQRSLGHSPMRAQADATSDPTAADVQFRQAMGFTTNPSAIAAINADPAGEAIKQKYGFAMTADELSKYTFQINLQNQLSEVEPQIVSIVGASYGGVSIDQAHGGLVTVRATRVLDDSEMASISGLLEPGAKLQYVVVKFSLTQLDSLAQYLVSSAAQFQSVGSSLIGYDVDILKNQVVVGVPTVTSDVQRLVSQLAGPGLSDSTAVVAATSPEPALSRTDYPPIIPGLDITVGGNFCTSGPLVHVSGQAYVLTAGHCADPYGGGGTGQGVVVDGQPLAGIVRFDKFTNGSSADVSFIGSLAATPKNCIYFNTTTCYATNVAKSAVMGATVFSSGRTSGTMAGTVTSTDIGFTNVAPGVSINHYEKSNNNIVQGDSGGPMFSGPTSDGHMVYNGVISAKIKTLPNTDYFTPWPNIAAYGASLG